LLTLFLFLRVVLQLKNKNCFSFVFDHNEIKILGVLTHNNGFNIVDSAVYFDDRDCLLCGVAVIANVESFVFKVAAGHEFCLVENFVDVLPENIERYHIKKIKIFSTVQSTLYRVVFIEKDLLRLMQAYLVRHRVCLHGVIDVWQAIAMAVIDLYSKDVAGWFFLQQQQRVYQFAISSGQILFHNIITIDDVDYVGHVKAVIAEFERLDLNIDLSIWHLNVEQEQCEQIHSIATEFSRVTLKEFELPALVSGELKLGWLSCLGGALAWCNINYSNISQYNILPFCEMWRYCYNLYYTMLEPHPNRTTSLVLTHH
jgi:hypothetical protein